jgi:hypothetical protein
MKNISLLIISLVLLFSSCKKDEINFDPNNPIIGIWNLAEYTDDAQVYTRNTEFIDENCYEFKSDGTMLERKNAGWCGTPPITYADYAGTWSVINDTLLQVVVAYWGGNTTYQLDIESVDSKHLKAALVFQVQE